MQKKILITGVGGMLGWDVLSLFNKKPSKDYLVIGITRKECDLTNRESSAKLISDVRPDGIIHCAAFTNVDDCESERDKAFLVNGSVTKHLAECAEGVGSRTFYISTDYVFDGEKNVPYEEDDRVFPVTAYGQSKREGEVATLQLGDKGAVIRTSWLFGHNGPNFVKAIIRKAKAEGKLKVVDDQKGSPTFTVDLAEGIMNIVEGGASGIFHISNTGECTWLEFAKEIVKKAGIEGVEINPISTEELSRPARRPKNSVLSCEKYNAFVGKPLKHWGDALEAYLSS